MMPMQNGGGRYYGANGGYSGGGYRTGGTEYGISDNSRGGYSSSGGYGGYHGSSTNSDTYSYGRSNSPTSVSSGLYCDDDDDKYRKARSSSFIGRLVSKARSSSFISRLLNSNNDQMSMICLALIFLSLVSTFAWWNVSSKSRSLMNHFDVDRLDEIKFLFEREQDLLHSAKLQTNKTVRAMKQEMADQMKELDATKQKLKKEINSISAFDQERAMSRDLAFKEQVALLQQATQRESKRTVLERFGPGPHQVQMTFEYPPSSNEQYNFIIELAPLDLVPHAIHLFLEQVEHGLWNDTSFYLIGDHVIQGGPTISREEVEIHKTRSSMYAFHEMDLDTLSFPEYSAEYPHTEWTVGFAGRPGGPDIYINLENNTEIHGPGGQHQHALSEYGDACFGKIVLGREFIERYLYYHEIYDDGSDWELYYKEPVAITGAVVLNGNNQ